MTNTIEQIADNLVRNDVILNISHALSLDYVTSKRFLLLDEDEMTTLFNGSPDYEAYFEEHCSDLDYTICDDGEINVNDPENLDDDGEILGLFFDSFEEACNYYEMEPDTYHEPLEHWVVSEYLADSLLEQGEAVVNTSLGYVWGRTTSGQAISMDYVIQKIAKDIHNM